MTLFVKQRLLGLPIGDPFNNGMYALASLYRSISQVWKKSDMSSNELMFLAYIERTDIAGLLYMKLLAESLSVKAMSETVGELIHV